MFPRKRRHPPLETLCNPIRDRQEDLLYSKDDLQGLASILEYGESQTKRAFQWKNRQCCLLEIALKETGAVLVAMDKSLVPFLKIEGPVVVVFVVVAWGHLWKKDGQSLVVANARDSKFPWLQISEMTSRL